MSSAKERVLPKEQREIESSKSIEQGQATDPSKEE